MTYDPKYVVNIQNAYGVAIGDNAQAIAAGPTERLLSAALSGPDLLAALQRANADLRNYRNAIAGIHLDRPEVGEIVSWATGASADQRLGMLLDQPGSGKTVVMCRVLTQLEELHVPTLAIKADLLSGVQSRADLMRWLDLPAEVEDCARHLASEGLFVVLIDQLDALSLTLTRDQATLDVVLSTLARLREIPNVRIIASCRTFDLHNDPRLSGIQVDRTFQLRPLEDDQIAQVLHAIGVDPKRLLPGHLQLLKTPLHLDVYVRTMTAEGSPIVSESFESLQELYAALWWLKIASPDPSRPSSGDRTAAIYRLVDAMMAAQQPSAPEACLDDLSEAARYLEREGLIRRDRGRWFFLHQTFLDYCYARRFVAKSHSLSQEVLNGPQGLFERSLIVQVLAYLRGSDRARYVCELDGLLPASSLRIHLRLLILGWLGNRHDPADEELAVVRRWTTDVTRRAQILNAFSGNAAWFDRIDQGLLSQWLVGEDGKPLSAAVSYLRSVINVRPAAVIRYLQPLVGQSQDWDAAASFCLTGLENWSSEEAVDLLCDLLARGAMFGREDLCFHSLAGSNPTGGCRALRTCLDYRLSALLAQKATTSEERTEPSLPELGKWRDRIRWEKELVGSYAVGELMSRAAQVAPEAIVHHLMPWFLRAISAAADEVSANSPQYKGDALFSSGWYEEHRSEGAAFAVQMAEALSSLARNNPPRFRSIAAELRQTEWLTIHRVLAKAYLSDPATYLDDILDYLAADRRRLFLGDMGDTHYESRLLYAAAFVRANPTQRLDLESLILDWQPEWERRSLRSEGSLQIAFLASVPRDLLSERARRRLQELERKFPGYKTPLPRGIEGGLVGPPIEPAAQEKMSDEQWLSAMRKYDDSTEWGAPAPELLKGGVIELSRSFEEHIKREPERFYHLAQRFDEQISLHYVTAAISGLADANAPVEWMIDLVRRNALRLNDHLRREVCWALRKRAEAGIPDDILNLVADWALNDPDPTEERCHAYASSGQTDMHQLGINSNRGAAALALVKCSLHREPPQVERAFWLLERAAADPSIAVRTCVIEALEWLLSHDRGRALDIFKRAMAGQPELLRSALTHHFLYWCLRADYARVRPFIDALLANEDEATRQAGASLACLAAFHEPGAMLLAERAITGDAAMRTGAAQVYARNLEYREIQAVCENGLRRLLDDPEEQVRKEVGKCFLYLRPEHLTDLRPFIRDFLGSPSLRSGAEHLVRYLKSVACDDYDLTLAATTRILDELGDTVLDIRTRWAILEADLVQLPLAVYQHAADPAIKARAMDLFERLLTAGSRSAHRALADWDRS